MSCLLKIRSILRFYRQNLCTKPESSRELQIAPIIRALASDDDDFHGIQLFLNKRPNFNSKNTIPVLEKCKKIVTLHREIEELAILKRDSDDCKEMQEIATADIAERQFKLVGDVESLVELITPPVGSEINSVTLEISGGVGGQEAMIWADNLFEMYQKGIPNLGLSFKTDYYDKTDIGGARKAFATITGLGAYKLLRYEGGIHRVQRVPKTERLGRLHTSTAAVIVMPQPSELEVALNPQDLVINFYRSSGPGGQHVNRTDSAVRITHNPTSIIVTCQEERSQHKNKELAMLKLRSILYEKMLESQLASERANRRLQVGDKSRSEKIRTYNWPRRQVTDHRLPAYVSGVNNLDDVMLGGKTFSNIIEALQQLDLEDRLLALAHDIASPQ